MAEVAENQSCFEDEYIYEEEEESLRSVSYYPYEFEQEDIYSSQSDPDPDPDPDPFSTSHEVNIVSQESPLIVIDEFNDSNNQDPFFRVCDDDLGLAALEVNNEFMIDNDNDDDYNDVVDDDIVSTVDFCMGTRNGSDSNDDGIGSDYDDEDDGIVGVDFRSCQEEVQDDDEDIDIPLCWDCLRLEDSREATNDFYEWEEVDDRADQRDILNMMMDSDERPVSASVEIRELQRVAMEREVVLRNLEWEVLMQVNHVERNAELEHDYEHDDFVYPAEYDMLFGQFMENESAIRSSLPTAKSVVESLPSMVLTQDDIKSKGSLCAVCKDEISTEEQAKLLPCSHFYHGECILPWLNIRNTCPVCRFELPTDDPDYEQRRTQREGHGSAAEVSQSRDDFEMFPEA
ncbi:hypothetical protein IFM89_025397 [Coptis chinensis]|uniref:RING-type E3 ubiquitin transferase n=1 Tax=Coptis chinensis TaxID=261450 RepID=A0A835H8P1_9MAGN|nr:hypothetical protein IFM89_025397 [Coptis chinensis]